MDSRDLWASLVHQVSLATPETLDCLDQEELQLKANQETTVKHNIRHLFALHFHGGNIEFGEYFLQEHKEW